MIYQNYIANTCYSEVISIIKHKYQLVSLANNYGEKKEFEALLGSLRVAGYETHCGEMLKALKKYE